MQRKKGSILLYQTFAFLMEQVTRIELASSPWQGGIIAVILYLQNVILLYQIIKKNTSLFLKKDKKSYVEKDLYLCYNNIRGISYE